MNPGDEAARLMREHGMKLVRSKNHLVYRHPDGRSFVVSATPSDYRVAMNRLHLLYRFLGIRRPSTKSAEAKTSHAEETKSRRRSSMSGIAAFTPTQLVITMHEQLRTLFPSWTAVSSVPRDNQKPVDEMTERASILLPPRWLRRGKGAKNASAF